MEVKNDDLYSINVNFDYIKKKTADNWINVMTTLITRNNMNLCDNGL